MNDLNTFLVTTIVFWFKKFYIPRYTRVFNIILLFLFVLVRHRISNQNFSSLPMLTPNSNPGLICWVETQKCQPYILTLPVATHTTN
jgi:hypothetical protein